MKVLLWAERKKLKRSKIVWLAVFATIMIAVIVFVQGQFPHNGVKYLDNAEWFMTAAQSLGTFFVLPGIIALLGGYIICREEQEDTAKSLSIIPVSETRLTIAKMIITLFFSVAIYLLLFLITCLSEAVLHFEDLSFAIISKFFRMYLINGLGIFFAILPIIALIARMKKGYWLALIFAEVYSFFGLFIGSVLNDVVVYPIIAVFNLSGYYEASGGQIVGSIVSLLICSIIAGIILYFPKRKENK